MRTGESLTQDLSCSANMRNLQTGIEAYAADHAGRFPDRGRDEPHRHERLRHRLAGQPLHRPADGRRRGEGNFRYDVSSDGGAYKLIGYGSGGKIVIELSGGDGTSV